MGEAIRSIFTTAAYTDPVGRDRSRLVYGITVLLAVLYGLYIFLVPTGSLERATYFEIALHDPLVLFYITTFYAAAIVTLITNRRGQLHIAAWGPLAMWFLGAALGGIQGGFVNAVNGIVLVGLIMLGGLLQNERGLIVGTGLALAALVAGIALRSSLDPASLPPYIISAQAVADTAPGDLLTLGLELIGVAGLIYLFLRYARLTRVIGAAEAVEERVKTAQIMTQITRQVAHRAPLTQLFEDIVTRINEKFDYIYHSQIFLIGDDGVEVRLVASTGEVGKKLLQRAHSIPVGSQSVIGQVTLQGRAIIARADDTNTIHRRNELLPETAVEAAFPLRIGDKIIGALDLQSKTVNAFDDADLIATFQTLADNTALAIDNVSQFERAEARLKENERLIAQTQTALREVERLNERLTHRAWSEFLRGERSDAGINVNFEANTVEPQQEWTPTLEEAVRVNQFVQDTQDARQVIAIPLRVRGQVVGAMEFELDQSRPFLPEDFDLLQEISERFGQAAENARLVEESQRAAQREALVNQISARLQATNNVDATLAEAARSLREVLKAEKIAIRLGTPPAQNSAAGGS